MICTQNFNPEAEQSHDNGRNTAMFSVLTKARKTAAALQKDFQQERIFFFSFAFQIIEFLFSSAKECQCSDPSKKSGSSSLELFMIYAYCHKGFEARIQRIDMTNMLDSALDFLTKDVYFFYSNCKTKDKGV